MYWRAGRGESERTESGVLYRDSATFTSPGNTLCSLDGVTMATHVCSSAFGRSSTPHSPPPVALARYKPLDLAALSMLFPAHALAFSLTPRKHLAQNWVDWVWLLLRALRFVFFAPCQPCSNYPLPLKFNLYDSMKSFGIRISHLSHHHATTHSNACLRGVIFAGLSRARGYAESTCTERRRNTEQSQKSRVSGGILYLPIEKRNEHMTNRLHCLLTKFAGYKYPSIVCPFKKHLTPSNHGAQRTNTTGLLSDLPTFAGWSFLPARYSLPAEVSFSLFFLTTLLSSTSPFTTASVSKKQWRNSDTQSITQPFYFAPRSAEQGRE
ncbi:uncharacterized protein BKA78DRAFT_33953 [Phyllosticta capitalensis]|uniref:uncharacterized protein n=1 Tax=Phyllosticta capitalensis TaxID=121624 RepID=UPI003131C089